MYSALPLLGRSRSPTMFNIPLVSFKLHYTSIASLTFTSDVVVYKSRPLRFRGRRFSWGEIPLKLRMRYVGYRVLAWLFRCSIYNTGSIGRDGDAWWHRK